MVRVILVLRWWYSFNGVKSSCFSLKFPLLRHLKASMSEYVTSNEQIIMRSFGKEVLNLFAYRIKVFKVTNLFTRSHAIRYSFTLDIYIFIIKTIGEPRFSCYLNLKMYLSRVDKYRNTLDAVQCRDRIYILRDTVRSHTPAAFFVCLSTLNRLIFCIF